MHQTLDQSPKRYSEGLSPLCTALGNLTEYCQQLNEQGQEEFDPNKFIELAEDLRQAKAKLLRPQQDLFEEVLNDLEKAINMTRVVPKSVNPRVSLLQCLAPIENIARATVRKISESIIDLLDPGNRVRLSEAKTDTITAFKDFREQGQNLAQKIKHIGIYNFSIDADSILSGSRDDDLVLRKLMINFKLLDEISVSEKTQRIIDECEVKTLASVLSELSGNQTEEENLLESLRRWTKEHMALASEIDSEFREKKEQLKDSKIGIVKRLDPQDLLNENGRRLGIRLHRMLENQVRSIHSREFQEQGGVVNPPTIQEFFSVLEKKDTELFILRDTEDASRIVGFCLGSVNATKGKGYLYQIICDQEFKSKASGIALLGALEIYGAGLVEGFHMNVHCYNFRSESFFQFVHGRPTGDLKPLITGNLDDLLLAPFREYFVPLSPKVHIEALKEEHEQRASDSSSLHEDIQELVDRLDKALAAVEAFVSKQTYNQEFSNAVIEIEDILNEIEKTFTERNYDGSLESVYASTPLIPSLLTGLSAAIKDRLSSWRERKEDITDSIDILKLDFELLVLFLKSEGYL